MQDWHVVTLQECHNSNPQHEVLYNISVLWNALKGTPITNNNLALTSLQSVVEMP